MYSRLSTLVTVACAAFAIAAPYVPRQDSGLLSGLGGQGGLSGLLGRDTTDAVSAQIAKIAAMNPVGSASPLPEHSITSTPRDVAQPTLPEIVIALTNDIKPIAAKLEAAVSVKADVKIEVIVDLLNDVVVLIEGAILQVKVIVANPAVFVLSVAGTIISVNELVGLVVILLTLVLNVLAVVTIGVQGLAAGAVLILVAKIGGLLAVVLGLAVQLVPNVIVLVVPQITAVLHVVYTLKLTSLIVVLGLPATPTY